MTTTVGYDPDRSEAAQPATQRGEATADRKASTDDSRSDTHSERATVARAVEAVASDWGDGHILEMFPRSRLKRPSRPGRPPATAVLTSGNISGSYESEFEEMLAIEQERAKQRKEANLKQNDRAGKISDSDEGEARDKAAERVNADVSGRTLEKGKTVKDKAESEDEPEEVREVATRPQVQLAGEVVDELPE